mgnify:FL=1
MNKYKFRNNLVQVLQERYENIQDVRFIITTDMEEGKTHNSKDDYLRLSIFNEGNLGGRLLSLEQVVYMFSSLAPLYPLWIEVYFREKGIVELKTSLRFRKPSVIKYKETGHPPFTVIE